MLRESHRLGGALQARRRRFGHWWGQSPSRPVAPGCGRGAWGTGLRKPNPSAKYYHCIHILGLPRRDSPSRNHGPSWPLPQTCPTLLCFFTGKSEVWRAHCEACNLLGSQSSAPRLDSLHDRAHMFERCWRTWSVKVEGCLLCLSSGVLVMDQRCMGPAPCPRRRREERQRFL